MFEILYRQRGSVQNQASNMKESYSNFVLYEGEILLQGDCDIFRYSACV
jgi:hypothetical protein